MPGNRRITSQPYCWSFSYIVLLSPNQILAMPLIIRTSSYSILGLELYLESKPSSLFIFFFSWGILVIFSNLTISPDTDYSYTQQVLDHSVSEYPNLISTRVKQSCFVSDLKDLYEYLLLLAVRKFLDCQMQWMLLVPHLDALNLQLYPLSICWDCCVITHSYHHFPHPSLENYLRPVILKL